MIARAGHVGHDCRAESDRHKPDLADLRDEGVTSNAAVGLFAARDALHLGDTASEVAELLRRVVRHNPVDVDDVWPDGPPEHWFDWANFDPTDAELEAAWNGPDSHEAHRAAWRLHQELRS